MDSNSTLKLALAIALLRTKHLKQQPSSSSSSESDAQKWKRKAKERKRDLIALQEELKNIEDGKQSEMFSQIASCKCHFFDNCGRFSPRGSSLGDDDRDARIDEVLRRRFLRQVRLTERRKRPGDSVRRPHFIELNDKDEIERLITSVDFLVELSNTVSPVVNDHSFATLSHQAVDFILGSLKNLLSREKDCVLIEEIVSGLITRLIRRMCTTIQREGSVNIGSEAQFCVQHVIRKLASEPFIGQRTLLSVSQIIAELADNFLFMDPFDDAFPNMHSCMFMMIQLIEFLISDYTQTWTSDEKFDDRLFEEWVRSVLQAKKALGLLESRTGLYALYMDRIIGELSKQVGSISCLRKIVRDVLDNLFQ